LRGTKKVSFAGQARSERRGNREKGGFSPSVTGERPAIERRGKEKVCPPGTNQMTKETVREEKRQEKEGWKNPLSTENLLEK